MKGNLFHAYVEQGSGPNIVVRRYYHHGQLVRPHKAAGVCDSEVPAALKPRLQPH